jgi:hypothetical protein
MMHSPQELAINDFIVRMVNEYKPTISPLELRRLGTSMLTCDMDEYPKVAGLPTGNNADGRAICETCRMEYREHPLDWRIVEHGNFPSLNILCDGRRVKL